MSLHLTDHSRSSSSREYFREVDIVALPVENVWEEDLIETSFEVVSSVKGSEESKEAKL